MNTIKDNVIALKPDYGLCKPDNGGYPLKPCPFCNSSPNLDQDSDSSWYVACINKRCFVLPITLPFKSKRHAAIAWNTRTESNG
ncbi:Lar family restriction alleviation protein [Vibrio parahaemolyticus]|uniref:Lar family restriction alleviation protein n=1 Tax=Vibrio parahaemolyticus TaxID=670 RepID=UPI00397F8F25